MPGKRWQVETPLVPRRHIAGRLTPSPSPGEPALFHVRLVDEEGTVAAQRWVRGNQRFHFQRLAPGAYRWKRRRQLKQRSAEGQPGPAIGHSVQREAWQRRSRGRSTAVLVAAGETTVVDITPPATEGAGDAARHLSRGGDVACSSSGGSQIVPIKIEAVQSVPSPSSPPPCRTRR